MSTGTDQVERLSPQRQLTVDYMRMANRRSNVHGLVEVDVTEARERIRRLEEEMGEDLSFTAYVVFCLARAIEEYPDVQAYRDWAGRIHRFDDVDVNVLVETTVDGEQIAIPHVVRGANRRSVRSIQEDFRSVKQSPPAARRSRLDAISQRLPAVVRRQLWRLPQLFPRRWQRLAGTVAVTSVGMFGTGSGWAVTPTNYTLQLTIGGIGTKPTLVDGEVTARDFLSLTVTFDHDVVDGAPAARFVQRLSEHLEATRGLEGDAGS
jgi:pyruvate/2-oxoglutarate dehydrogenase complex dihydrolipoamide acyltransferase (E2) component